MIRNDKKQTVIWGSGFIAENALKNMSIPTVSFILDNDRNKANSSLCGFNIFHPDNIDDWNGLYIIIAVFEWECISEQLERYGLEYERDFMDLFSFYKVSLKLDKIQEALSMVCFRNESPEFETIVYKRDEYESLCRIHNKALLYSELLESVYSELTGNVGVYYGYCPVCERNRPFMVKTINGQINWRESTVDSACLLSLRKRFIFSLCRSRYKGKRIYMYEQVTDLFKYFCSLDDEVIGSEFLSPSLKSGQIVDGIRHEDAMNLSFDDEYLDVIVSCDVFEHVSNHIMAIKEAYRCLRHGGTILISVPFFTKRDKNVIRAYIEKDGSVSNILEPCYHGNPLSNEGSLVFTDFGWELLEDMRAAGFDDAHLLVYNSPAKGYVSKSLQFIIEATKE